MDKAVLGGTLIILKSPKQDNEDFVFLECCFNKIITIVLNENADISTENINTPIYVLAYDCGCLLVSEFIAISKLSIEAIFFISPPLLRKRIAVRKYTDIEKVICKVKLPIVIFNSNTEYVQYHNYVADLMNNFRMVYNIVIKSNKKDILTGSEACKQQLLQAIKAYISN